MQTLPPLHHHGVRRGGETDQVVSAGVHGVDGHVLQHHSVHHTHRLAGQRQLLGRVVPGETLLESWRPFITINLLSYLGRSHQSGLVVVVQPLVVQHVSGTQPLLSVLHQQFSDEILGWSGHCAPLLGVELELALLDVVEEVELAEVAGPARSPGALVATGATEGRVAAEQDVHHDAQTPEVTSLVVLEIFLGVFYEGFHDLGCHELG